MLYMCICVVEVVIVPLFLDDIFVPSQAKRRRRCYKLMYTRIIFVSAFNYE